MADIAFLSNDNFSFGPSSPPGQPKRDKSKAISGSVKSTKSLYFTDPDASGLMARDEEVTLDIYDIYSDDSPIKEQSGGKIKRSEVSSSFKSGSTPILNGAIQHKSIKKSNTSASSTKKTQGGFKMKTAGPTTPRVPSSSSLHDESFKASLSNTLTRKIQSSVHTTSSVSETSLNKSPSRFPNDVFSSTPSRPSTDHVQTSQAVRSSVITGLSNRPQSRPDGGNDISPGAGSKTDSYSVTATQQTKVQTKQSARNSGDSAAFINGYDSNLREVNDNVNNENMIIQETRIIQSHSQSASKTDNGLTKDKNTSAGKFEMRYKEGPDPGKVNKPVIKSSENKSESFYKSKEPETISLTSSVSSLLKDEKFTASISGLFGAGRAPDVSASAPSSLHRKKRMVQSIDINIDEKVTPEPMTPDREDFEINTFPRDVHARKEKENITVSSTPTSPYDEMKETVKDGKVGTLVKDLFKNIPLTGRAIDPSAFSTLEKLKKPKPDPEKKYKFAVEGIDTPDRPPDDDDQFSTLSSVKRPLGVPMFGPPPPPAFSNQSDLDTVNGSSECMDTHMSSETIHYSSDDNLGGNAIDHSEEISSMKRIEKKGFSYINKEIQQDVVKRAGDFTARRPHEAIDANIEKSKAEKVTNRDSQMFVDAKAKLQKNESSQNREKVKDANQSISPDATLMAAKSNLHKQSPQQKGNFELKSQQSLIRSSALLDAKNRLKSTGLQDDQEIVESVHIDAGQSKTKTIDKSTRSNANKQEDENKNVIGKISHNASSQESKTTITKVEVKSAVKNVSSGNAGGNKPSTTAGVTKKIDSRSTHGELTHTPVAVEWSKASTRGEESTAKTNNRGSFVGNSGDRTSVATAESSVHSSVTKLGKASQQTTVGSGNLSPDFHSPHSVDAPDSAYYSDSKVSPNFDFMKEERRNIKNLIGPGIPETPELTSAHAKTEHGLNRSDISKYIIKSAKTGKTTEKSSTVTKATERNDNAIDTLKMPDDSGKSKDGIRSLREVKKAAQRMKAVDIEYDLNEPLRVTQHETTAASQKTNQVNSNVIYGTKSHEKQTTSTGVVNKQTTSTNVVNKSSTTTAATRIEKPELQSSSESGSEAPTPTPGNLHIEIPNPDDQMTRNERSVNKRMTSGRNGDRGDENGFSFTSSTKEFVVNGREIPITHYSNPNYSMDSPGASSTQTDNTYSSTSVPIVSPSVSRASSMSTTAQDTFEYSKAHKRRYQQRVNRTHMDRGPLQPLTININPEPRGRHQQRHQPSGRSKSETRATLTHLDSRYDAGSPAVNHEPSMFRTSHMSDHEMTTSQRTARQPAQRPNRYQRRTAHENISYGQPLSPHRDPHRMRPREESFNSHSTGPLSPPGRYLRVDETRGGRVPIYGRRGRSIRELDGREYSQHTSSSRRVTEGLVSRVNVDDAYDHGDAYSAISEPVYGTNSGKYSIHRVMERRGMNGAHLVHPDMNTQQRKRVYNVTSGGTTSAVRMLNSYGSRTDLDAVDPELENADKQGNNYNITLKLNAMGSSRPGSRHDQYHEEQTVNNHIGHRYDSYHDNDQMTYNYRNHRSLSHGQYDREFSPDSTARRQMTIVKIKNPGEEMVHGQHSTSARFKVRHDAPELTIHGQSVSSEREYMIKSMTGSNMNYADSQLSPASGSDAPRFTMTVNQTMTMDYVAPTDEETEETMTRTRTITQERPHRKKRNKRETHTDRYYNMTVENGFDSSRQAPAYAEHTRTSIERERKHRRKGQRKMNEDDFANYLSPAEEQDYGAHDGEMPQVVRGSILIKNSIDTTGAPRVIDVVEGDNSDDEVIVDDNVNMFHGTYFQSRENPMYSSDPDLAGPKSSKSQQNPAFTQIFDGKEKYREIPVNRDPKRRQRTTERTQRTEQRTEYQNGHDEVDSSHMTREQRTEYEISRLLKGAPKGSIKQSINVEREEEDILGPLPTKHADGSHARPEDMLNFDTVSEKVDMGLRDGKAEVAVKVRCERIVPIRGVDDMFKKSSVIVTRLIEIDLMATEERRQLWEKIERRSKRGAITDGSESRSGRDMRLSTKDTFNLYKTFMGLAEADDNGKQRMRIDRQIDEERRPELYAGPDGKMVDDQLNGGGFDTDELDRRLEDELVNNYQSKNMETDSMSFVSAASETRDMLY